jgi:hypothetical protein
VCEWSSTGEIILNIGEVKIEEKKAGEFGLGDKEWHLFSPDELMTELTTSIHGLSTEEHAIRLEKWGENLITLPKPLTG